MRDRNKKLHGRSETVNENNAEYQNSGGISENNIQEKEDVQEREDRRKKKSRKRKVAAILLLILILILLLLCFRSCRARDEPFPEDIKRVYEEDHSRDRKDDIPAGEEKRLNLAVAGSYRITDEKPYFYIGFPAENAYDVVFSLKDEAGDELYRTNYVSAGTNVAIDGTAFLPKGEQKVDCLVSVYDHGTGELVSDCTTVVLNINYE